MDKRPAIPLAKVQIEAQLLPGDVLLYKPTSIYGLIIWAKTWHRISHVEVYDGDGYSWASRDGIGFNRYPLRIGQLAKVLRPTKEVLKQWDLDASRRWATEMIGTPYGWLDLTAFVGVAK